ncbi:MAG: DUF3429 domain-containing protein [Azoarcus sp.]|nr:DUF3429 domain-containing protein [Azoarcus sp.]
MALLGYGGLLPFVLLAVAVFVDGEIASRGRDALLAYGGVILSFVGALHWGFAMSLAALSPRQRTLCFIWSVVPALLAWPALLVDTTTANVLLIGGFLSTYWQYRRLAVSVGLPGWYLPLRSRLTVVACLCLIAGSVGP